MNNRIVEPECTTLLELLDRLVETGVVLDGEIDLSVADIDLIHLGVKLVLASSATLEQHNDPDPLEGVRPADHPAAGSQAGFPAGPTLRTSPPLLEATSIADTPIQSARAEPVSDSWFDPGEEQSTEWLSGKNELPRTDRDAPTRSRKNATHAKRGERRDIDPSKIEHDLARLVLTLVELIRRLMEKQALRRMEHGTLNMAQLERLGEAFRRLEIRMGDLKRVFGLQDEQLNLSLGPLGTLM